eukprot:m.795670 g.795670  ORF g.795670 m.795670 type:complete len:362 (-) comp59245_c0_seq4:378-1463(-)
MSQGPHVLPEILAQQGTGWDGHAARFLRVPLTDLMADAAALGDVLEADLMMLLQEVQALSEDDLAFLSAALRPCLLTSSLTPLPTVHHQAVPLAKAPPSTAIPDIRANPGTRYEFSAPLSAPAGGFLFPGAAPDGNSVQTLGEPGASVDHEAILPPQLHSFQLSRLLAHPEEFEHAEEWVFPTAPSTDTPANQQGEPEQLHVVHIPQRPPSLPSSSATLQASHSDEMHSSEDHSPQPSSAHLPHPRLVICDTCNHRFVQRQDPASFVWFRDLLKEGASDTKAQPGALCQVCSGKLDAFVPNRTRGYTCHQCQQLFRSSDRLLAHSARHNNGLKAFCCTACGKTFSRQARLFAHQHRFGHSG